MTSYSTDEWEPDSRDGTPDCGCGHTSHRHHGTDRSGTPISSGWPGTRCKDCTWCDYYKPQRFLKQQVAFDA